MNTIPISQGPSTFSPLQSDSLIDHVIKEHVIKEVECIFPNTHSIYVVPLKESKNLDVHHKGFSLLHYCVYYLGSAENLSNLDRKLNLLKYLIKNGANVNVVDSHGRTPLFFANHPEAVDILIKAGATLNPVNSPVAPLHVLASLPGRSPLPLIEKGANCAALDKYGRTPLHCALMNGNEEKAQLFLERASGTTEIKDKFDNYPLYYAVLFCSDTSSIVDDVTRSSSPETVQAVLDMLSKNKSFLNINDDTHDDVLNPDEELPHDEEKFSILTSMMQYDDTSSSLRTFTDNDFNTTIPTATPTFNLEEFYKVYDEIYNIPNELKEMRGGGNNRNKKIKEKEKKMKRINKKRMDNTNKSEQTPKEPPKAAPTVYTSSSGITVSLTADEHGEREHTGAAHNPYATNKTLVKTTKKGKGQFTGKYAEHIEYIKLLNTVIKSATSQGLDPSQNPNQKMIFNIGKNVGVSGSEKTSYVRLIYNPTPGVGSHIYPVPESKYLDPIDINNDANDSDGDGDG